MFLNVVLSLSTVYLTVFSAETAQDVVAIFDEVDTNDDTSYEVCKRDLRNAILAVVELKMALKKSQHERNAERKLHESIFKTAIVYDEKTDIYKSITCEWNTAKLGCPSSNKLIIKAANYGRRDNDTCRMYKDALYSTNCTTPGTLNIVENKCKSNPSCDVDAANYVFGDPCPRTNKYLEIIFACVDEVTTAMPSQSALVVTTTTSTNVPETTNQTPAEGTHPSFETTTEILSATECSVADTVSPALETTTKQFHEEKTNQTFDSTTAAHEIV